MARLHYIKLNNFIRTYKDKNNILSNNNVVFKITCLNCDVSYVSQTKKRQLGTRLKEDVKLNPSKHSVIKDHIKNNHNFNWRNVRIFDSLRKKI